MVSWATFVPSVSLKRCRLISYTAPQLYYFARPTANISWLVASRAALSTHIRSVLDLTVPFMRPTARPGSLLVLRGIGHPTNVFDPDLAMDHAMRLQVASV